MGYIHLYCTGPPRMASQGRWTARWTITSKKAGGKYFSSLHSMRSIRLSNFSKSLFLRVLEHKSWKKLPNSNNTMQMSLSTKPRSKEKIELLLLVYKLCFIALLVLFVYTTYQWQTHLCFLVFNIEWMRAT